MKNIIASTLIVCWALAGFGQVTKPPAMSADEIMAKVLVRNRERDDLSQGYAGRRLYVFDNEKWHKHAELLAAVKTDRDGTKTFEVLNEQGWKAANNHVLSKMLESETETSRPTMRSKTVLTPDNYSFSLLETDLVEGRPTYVIEVVPKRHDKYLIEGRIWVDASDYAVVRCEGKPARNPSFWTRSIQFVHEYKKSGEFWFPHTTQSVTQALLFGKTEVVIQYFDYVPNTVPKRDPAPPQNAALQEANYVSNH